MVPGFKLDTVETTAATINFRRGGDGPPVPPQDCPQASLMLEAFQ